MWPIREYFQICKENKVTYVSSAYWPFDFEYVSIKKRISFIFVVEFFLLFYTKENLEDLVF